MTNVIELLPIGVVRGGRKEPLDDGWDRETATIEIDGARFKPDALAGLSEFSHVDVVYQFHLVEEQDVQTGARHPRGRKDWPLVGIFAQRGRVRPNRLGVTTCRLLSLDGLS